MGLRAVPKFRCCEYEICGITVRKCVPANETCQDLVIQPNDPTPPLVDDCEDCPECPE
ncbi:hypothetical protein AM1BK_30950 [Neobacillus kokaensis]|uniref:Uncharacterized protein n=1 Tax=Neobacillus kokaensis TaxID=2759023 RepID=A0ABQ3N7T1_9BACI|nr:hypothetical protein AM1BK_30950 [Neobacillus kokaensis]